MRRAFSTQSPARPNAVPLPAFPSRRTASVQPLTAFGRNLAAAPATSSLPSTLRPHHSRYITTATAAGAPPSSCADDPSGPTSPPPADIEATCLRCVIWGTTGDVADNLSDVLLSFGAQSVVVQEHRPPGSPEQEIYDDGEAKLWDSCDVVAYFSLETDVESVVAIAEDALELGGGSLSWAVEAVANEAWVDQIRASYVPLQITEDLWIIPEWSEPQDPTATNIILQPGVAFGTGEHPTTRLCLQALREAAAAGSLQGVAVCDYGAGSGVLALAALKYGAARAVGTDIDSLAVKAAQRNGALNGFSEPQFQVFQCGAGLDDEEPLAAAGLPPALRTFDLVVANILRGPLIELRERLTGYVAPGGRLMLSGILAEQAPEIMEAYGRDFTDFEMRTDQQWACLMARRK